MSLKTFGARFAWVGFSTAAVAAGCHSDDADGAAAPTIVVTVSGEDAALDGFAFPGVTPDAPAVVDGWEIVFDRMIVTIDHVTLSDGPDSSPTDQSVTGPVVAAADGPWAVDLTKPGTPSRPAEAVVKIAHGDHDNDESTVPGTGRGSASDRSIRLVRFAEQNKNGGKAFDPSRRYAIGYQVVASQANATRLNLSPEAEADYTEMITSGASALYAGRAIFRGPATCRSGETSKLPTEVPFRFLFQTPTSYINCQNTDLDGQPFDGEEKPRGIQVRQGGDTYAQLTFHSDHLFWNTVDHDGAEMRFDAMALAAASVGATNRPVTLDDLATLDPTNFQDKEGRPVPANDCRGQAPAANLKFDTGGVPVNPSADPGQALRNYADLVRYLQSSSGHLNADGLCAISRNYPSPR
jgi:hypothetical protein